MPKRMRTIVRSVLGIIVVSVLGFGLSGCSNDTPAVPKPKPSVPANILTVTLNNEGQIAIGQPMYVTDKPALELRMIVRNHGGGEFSSSPMNDKIVNVTNLTRTDLTQPMKLGAAVIGLIDTGEYGGFVDMMLPQGTYELQLDGKPTGAKFTVAPKATPKPASVPK